MKHGTRPGKSNEPALNLRNRLVLGTAFATSAFIGGYTRRAYAACAGSLGTYTCSGVTTTTQSLPPIGLPATVLNVSTVPGFSIDTRPASGGGSGNAFTLNGTGGLTFTDANQSTIAGQNSGIFAENLAGGALSITTTGAVTGTTAGGIIAQNDVSGTDLTINAAAVAGEERGIDARNFGTGALSITATGLVTGATVGGIYAFNNVNGTDLTIEAAAVNSASHAILARNDGSGALSITATGTLTSTSDNSAINVRNSGTDLTIETAAVSGINNGILAYNFGTGALSINATGLVTGARYSGISANNYAAGTDLTIAATGDVSGASNGILANNYGTGALSITATGTVAGANRSGIRALNDVTGTDLRIATTGDVSGEERGIVALNNGSGALSITATGTVTGARYSGISAHNYVTGTDLTIETATVSGESHAIFARNYGSGALSIKSTGTLTAISRDSAINVTNYGTDLTIETVAVSGQNHGILADNFGTGALAITATGTATGTSFSGINATNRAAGTDLTIVATGDASGGHNGINANNFGTGALTITANGTETGARYSGISANNSAAGTDLTIVATGEAIGEENGINASNSGTGALTITATGTVTGASFTGINTRNNVTGTDLTIVASGDVSGGENGINGTNYGTGALSITVSGAVVGGDGRGILAVNNSNASNSTTDVTVQTGTSVVGGNEGVELFSDTGRSVTLQNSGSISGATGVLANTSGTVVITNSGSITGTAGTAIDLAGGGPGAVFVSGGTITGDINAEFVRLTGGTLHGNVTGLTTLEIEAGNSLTVDDGMVFEGDNANATIINTDLSAGGTRSQVFTGFDTVFVDPSTISFTTGTIGINQLNLQTGSTLFVSGNVNMTGSANLSSSTLDMLNGVATDRFTLGGLVFNNSTLAIDINQQTGQADQIAATSVSALNGSVLQVGLIGTPVFSQVTTIPILLTSGGVNGTFTTVGIPGGQSALFNYATVSGPSGLSLQISPTVAGTAIAVMGQPQVNQSAVDTSLNALDGINGDAIATDLGLAVSSQGAQVSPTVGVFASGQFAHTEHDGFSVSTEGFDGQAVDFDVDEFSAALSIDFNAAKHFGFDEKYGLNLGVFAGYASADVSQGSFEDFETIGDANNKSGMFGGYGLFREGYNYALVSTIVFLGETDMTNDVLNSTGSYDTEGYAVSALAGHIYKWGERARFDLRGGLLGVTFTGDEFTDTGGNQYGQSEVSFGALKFEPGIYADYALENGMTFSPYARADLQQRFGYENTASIDGVDIDFDDADFSAAVATGFNLKMSKRSTMSGEVRGKFSSDSSTLGGKIGLKVAF